MTYNSTEIVTGKGQSGAAIQWQDDLDVENKKNKILGVHVGNHADNNYGTLIIKNMFIDFILETLR